MEAPAAETPAPEAAPTAVAPEASSGDIVQSEVPAETPQPLASDDGEDGEEPPRVGVAVTPKRSLLADGIGADTAEAEQARFQETAGTAAPESPPPAPESGPEPAPATGKPGRLFSLLRGAERATPGPEREPTGAFADGGAPAPAADILPEPSPIAEEPAAAPAPLPFVRFQGVTKTYDGKSLVVKGLDLDIARGEFLTLLGPSGSGKTTTLMMLAGFEQPTSGEILLNGTALTDLPPHKRGLGFVFQNYALFPHMTVQDNVAFPLEVRRLRGSEIRERVARALAMVELSGFEKRKPAQLSGGQQQRVAMARALVFNPELVLMDEPLGALDKHLREQMQYELKRLHRELGVTVVYVTHDQGEALTLSDRIAVFHDGVIQQLDTPSRIYDEPANAFVAGFVGENNALPGKIAAIRDAECIVELIGGARVRALNGNCSVVGQNGVVCVRPEDLSISAETTPGGNHVAALVEDYIFHGDHLRVKLSAPGMSELFVKMPARSGGLPAKGVAVTLLWEPAAARAFAS